MNTGGNVGLCISGMCTRGVCELDAVIHHSGLFQNGMLVIDCMTAVWRDANNSPGD